MLLLAHLGITVFLATLVKLPIGFSIIGVLLPDIIDKILYLEKFTPCGRFIGHTIIFGLISSLITYTITKGKRASLAILFGIFLHLLEDVQHFIPWFYPIVEYQFLCEPIRIEFTPTIIFTEFIGVILLILTLGYNSKILYFRDKFYLLLRSKIKKSINFLKKEKNGNNSNSFR